MRWRTSTVSEYYQATAHNFNPHNVKVLSDENNTIKRRVKEAFAIKQRKPSLYRDGGSDLSANYNPFLGIQNFSVTQPVTSQLKADEIWVIQTNVLKFPSEFWNFLY